MFLIASTIVLILVGVVAYIYGAIRLSKYAFRISSGLGIGVLLFPPLTFYFALWKLEEEGKELPTALCMFGLVTTIILVAMFWTPLSLFASGEYDERLAQIEANQPNFEASSAETPPAPAPAPAQQEGAPTEGAEAPAENSEAAEGSEAPTEESAESAPAAEGEAPAEESAAGE